MTKHLITLLRTGFLCSCGERREGPERPASVASQHQLAALMQDAMNGSGPLVTNCLACNGESLLPAPTDETIATYATWIRSPCAFCGKKPADVAGPPSDVSGS